MKINVIKTNFKNEQQWKHDTNDKKGENIVSGKVYIFNECGVRGPEVATGD